MNLKLRLCDWSDTTTETHWNVVLNDGTDHTVALSAYANVTGTYTDFNIPLSAFGANLANAQYVRLVHKDTTFAVLLIDAISIDGGVGPTSTPRSTATNTLVVPTATRTNTSVAPTNTRTKTPVTTTPTKTPTHLDPTRTNTPVGPTNTSTQTLTRTNTAVAATNTPTRTDGLILGVLP